MGTPDQELIKAIEEKAGFTGNALQVARAILDGAAAALEHYGKVDIHVSVKIFKGGVWEVANLPLNIAKGDDLILVFNDDGVELSSKITLINWLNLSTRVENICLNDGSEISLADVQKDTNENDFTEMVA